MAGNRDVLRNFTWQEECGKCENQKRKAKWFTRSQFIRCSFYAYSEPSPHCTNRPVLKEGSKPRLFHFDHPQGWRPLCMYIFIHIHIHVHIHIHMYIYIYTYTYYVCSVCSLGPWFHHTRSSVSLKILATGFTETAMGSVDLDFLNCNCPIDMLLIQLPIGTRLHRLQFVPKSNLIPFRDVSHLFEPSQSSICCMGDRSF